MKRIFLVRHAKSAWDDPALGDFERPLAPRGRAAARRMADHMHHRGLIPDHVMCSTAARARETWALMAPILGPDIPLEPRRDLYHAAPWRLLDILREAPDVAASLLVIAHSPGMEGLAMGLAGAESDENAVERLTAKFPTAALAVIEFNGGDWSAVAENGGRLTRFVAPRDLS
jgi:phosphohistidine phosphatase